MEAVAAIVTILAGSFTIILRIREMQHRKDPASLRAQTVSGILVDSEGHELKHRLRSTPAMIIPALALTALIQIIVLMGGAIFGVVLVFAAKTPPQIAANHSLIVVHTNDLDNIHLLIDYADGSITLADSTVESEFEKSKSAMLDYMLEAMTPGFGVIIMALAFPLMVVFGFRRAFFDPQYCFRKAIIMGAWMALFMGLAELLLGTISGYSMGVAISSAIGKSFIFFCFGLGAGILYVFYRSISKSKFVQLIIAPNDGI